MDKKIKILPGGPYEVTEDVPLNQAIIDVDHRGTSMSWKEGKKYPEQKEPYHLCRCGQSKNKPYCDGTHEEVHFIGKESADKSPYTQGCKVYEGGSIDLYDNESLCSSMRFCDRGEGVWQAAIDSDNASSKQLAMEEVAACASGRLTIAEKDGTFVEPILPKEISLVEDTAANQRGPLWVKGGIVLEGADGEKYEVRNRMTLCRCGQSRNMPFCDISHMECPHMKGFDK